MKGLLLVVKYAIQKPLRKLKADTTLHDRWYFRIDGLFQLHMPQNATGEPLPFDNLSRIDGRQQASILILDEWLDLAIP